mmetsp:Transcript_11904/g.34152  ORF Transcript_11904/g.34152 Transcript_11904/m.34152 type:complete len:85 (+) Transcript_11904:660-914(+)
MLRNNCDSLKYSVDTVGKEREDIYSTLTVDRSVVCALRKHLFRLSTCNIDNPSRQSTIIITKTSILVTSSSIVERLENRLRPQW